MSCEIQALIGKAGTLKDAGSHGLAVVSLSAGFEIAPLSKEVRSRLGIQFCPLTDEGEQQMPAELDALCRGVSAGWEIAYIEAEMFGGDGTQAFSLYRNGALIEGPVVDDFAINEVLAALGVEAGGPERDEFDTVGLGKHRHTDGWR